MCFMAKKLTLSILSSTKMNTKHGKEKKEDLDGMDRTPYKTLSFVGAKVEISL